MGHTFIYFAYGSNMFMREVLCVVDGHMFTFSGNSPGIQREASTAGNTRRSGARELSETSTPARSVPDNATRLALAGSHNACGIPTGKLSPVEDRFEDRPPQGLELSRGLHPPRRFCWVNRSSAHNGRQNCLLQFCCVPGPRESR